MENGYANLHNRLRTCLRTIWSLRDSESLVKSKRHHVRHPLISQFERTSTRGSRLGIILLRLNNDYKRMVHLQVNVSRESSDYLFGLMDAEINIETSYIYANLLLNEWAKTIAKVLDLPNADQYTFAELYFKIRRKGNIGKLNTIRKVSGKDITKAYIAIRLFRNELIEHAKIPWESTLYVADKRRKFIVTHHVSTDDINLDDLADMADDVVDLMCRLPRSIRDTLESFDHFEQPHRALKMAIEDFDKIKDDSLRKRILDVYKKSSAVNNVEDDLGAVVRILEMTMPIVQERLSGNTSS